MIPSGTPTTHFTQTWSPSPAGSKYLPQKQLIMRRGGCQAAPETMVGYGGSQTCYTYATTWCPRTMVGSLNPKGAYYQKRNKTGCSSIGEFPPSGGGGDAMFPSLVFPKLVCFILKPKQPMIVAPWLCASIAPFMVFSVTYYVESRNAVTSCSGARFFFERKWKRLFRRRNRT